MAIERIEPYELSVWEYTMAGAPYESKLAVIGSNQTDSPTQAYGITLHKNVNGETDLTFSMKYKYFDPIEGDYVINPFTDYLINERKIKLFYDDKWYDFLIRNHTESSDGMVWTYTAKDAFVIELSKNGYNVEFNTELNNNQGTAIELGKRTLAGTDWKVDEENSDDIIQKLEEPLYTVTVQDSFEALDINNKQTVTIAAGEIIYVFYNYITGRDNKFVQFIREIDSESFEYDDDKVITAPNYRIQQDVEYVESAGLVTKIKVGNAILNVGAIYSSNHAYRLVYKQFTTYDPVADQIVDLYQVHYDNADPEDIYHYIDYDYTTSQVVTSYITNGSDFDVAGGSYLSSLNHGWEAGASGQSIQLVSYPDLGVNAQLAKLTSFTEVEGFLEFYFGGASGAADGWDKSIFNSGIQDNATLINSFSKGEEFVLRMRYAYSSEQHGTLTPGNSNGYLRAVVAKYTTEEDDSVYVKKVNPNGIILNFGTGALIEDNNYISTGHFINDMTAYVIDDVVQEPSTKYCYRESGTTTDYVWDINTLKYVLKSSKADFRNYYYTTAVVQESISNATLTDPETQIGIFLYCTTNPGNYYYVEDIQLTRCIRDADGNVVTIGNIPTAKILETDCFYRKPKDNATKADIEFFHSAGAMCENLGIEEDQLTPLYDEKHLKVLSIEEAHSNCFNILQDIAEKFECWVKYDVAHEDNGAISLVNGKPDKRILFKNYAGKENFAGFKYQINLSSIERTLDSEEIVTKLIVDPIQNDYVNDGIVSIQQANSNPSGESYLLNFDYYVNKGLIKNGEQCVQDLIDFNTQLKAKNILLNEWEQKRINLESALVQLNAKRTTFSELIAEAKKKFNEGQFEFEQLTGDTYDEFVTKYNTPSEGIDTEDITAIVKNETIIDTIGKIYLNATVINNYSGLFSNINTEYHKVRTECYGTETYTLTASATGTGDERKVTVTLNEYIDGFEGEFLDSNNNPLKTFESNANEKVFTLSGLPCVKIEITHIPTGYTTTAPSTIDLTGTKIVYYKLIPETEVKGCIGEIKELQEQKDAIEHEFYECYGQFVQEGTWSSQDYIDANLYYLDALQVSNNSSQPKVTYDIKVAEISEIEGFEAYDFAIGDKTFVEDTEFFGYDSNGRPVREEIIISEIETHLDNPSENTITVQNYKTRFEDLFQRLNATVQTVNYNELSYAKTTSILNQNGTINQKLLLSSLNEISGREYNLTSDGTIISNSEGLLIRDLTNPQLLVKICGGGIKVSNTAGDTWSTAIDGNGINVGEVYTGVLNTQKIIIQDGDKPSFRWDKAGISAYKTDAEVFVKTTDISLIQNKDYYFFNSNSKKYELVSEPRVEDLNAYYELSYIPTTDTEIVEGKKYYTFNNNTGLYEVVTVPNIAYINTYFEKEKAYDLRTFVRFDQNGLYGIEKANVYQFNTIEQVEQNASFGLTWHGFFIKSKKRNGYISITNDNDIQVWQNVPDQNDNDHYIERIKIGEIGPDEFGMTIKNSSNQITFRAGSDGNVTIAGTINAWAGNFSGQVTVGQGTNNPYIIIDGNDAYISTSNYSPGAGMGWAIDANGDAVFNNITARGAIKTAVFEYAEIQAVGGVFLFRPSSTIKTAEPVEVEENGATRVDLVVTVEKPQIFKEDRWCKISNYYSGNNDPDTIDSQTHSLLQNNGLTHVYEISDITQIEQIDHTIITYITLEGAGVMVSGNNAVTTVAELIGGALVDMGDASGNNNYGIGINSSDNTVNLPARAISLFKTEVNTSATGNTPKVTYNYQGILGTLPELSESGQTAKVNSLYNTYQAGKQGIYTDNMYIGDKDQYIAFYSDGTDRHLKISAQELVFGIDENTHQEITWEQHINDQIDVPSGMQVIIDSTNGTVFTDGEINTVLTCKVYKDGVDITSTLTGATFTWTKAGDNSWTPPVGTTNSLTITGTDVGSAATFQCVVSIPDE